MGEDPAPQPEAVTTLADLARQLSILRLCAGNPSFRTLEQRAQKANKETLGRVAQLPRQTANDIERGQHLPRMETVRTFVLACGVEEAREIERWLQAWRRVAFAHKMRGPTQAVVDAPQVPPDEDDVNSDVAFFSGRKPTAKTVAQLAAIPVRHAADYLSKVAPDEAAFMIAEMEVMAAARRLSAMTPEHAAAIVLSMDERLAGARLREISPTDAVMLFSHMPAQRVVDLLGELPDDWVASAAMIMPIDFLTALLGSSRTTPQLVKTMLRDGSPNRSAWILGKLPREQVLPALGAMGMEKAAHALAASSAIQAAVPLRQMSSERAAETLSAMPTEQAARILEVYDPAWSVVLLRNMTAERSAQILAEMMYSKASAVLEASPPQSLASTLLALPADRFATILREINPTEARNLLTDMGADRVKDIIANLQDPKARELIGNLTSGSIASSMSDEKIQDA